MILMNLSTFIENMKLPDGIELYDFADGCMIVPVVSNGGYLTSKMIRLVKGEQQADIEISRLDGTPPRGDMISVEHFAQKIEEAIRSLK